jgi:hypothetical protein
MQFAMGRSRITAAMLRVPIALALLELRRAEDERSHQVEHAGGVLLRVAGDLRIGELRADGFIRLGGNIAGDEDGEFVRTNVRRIALLPARQPLRAR